jgi:hypothetical protein
MLTTFPAQALPCSGSTGIFSAVSSTPRNLMTLFVGSKGKKYSKNYGQFVTFL